MRDAVGLVGKEIIIDDIVRVIEDFYHVPGNYNLYVKLRNPDESSVNYRYADLQPYLMEQVKL
jgi:hypothetical protein